MAYIVPLEMPKTCVDCFFSCITELYPFWSEQKDKRGTKTLCCQAHEEHKKIVLDINDKTTKADWCPLVEVQCGEKERRVCKYERYAEACGSWCTKKHQCVSTMNGYTGICDDCPYCGADMRGE